MKRYSANGKGSGKLGGSVYVINHGVQIEREYNGSVSNPSTSAQVAQRSRFKLASQVSAALENVIVIPRKGIISPRNRFVKRNMPFFYGDVNGAQVTYENLQLTLGSNGIPSIYLQRIAGGQITLQLTDWVNDSCSHVAYCIFKKTDEELLQLVRSEVVEVNEDNYDASVTIGDPGGDLIVYAYGYRMKNAKAKAKYDNYQVSNALDMATLIANRRIELSDVYFTATRGTSIAAGDQESVTPSAGEFLLYLSTNFLGTIKLEVDNVVVAPSASGVYKVHKESRVKLTEIPAQLAGNDYAGFDGWFNNGEQTPFSMETFIEFDMTSMRDIVARWHPWSGLE